jgi:hypothetical protein
MLLILEAFFLSDVTFLNAEIATGRLWLGLGIDSILFGLAAIKLLLMFRTLGLQQSPAHFVFVLIQLAAILAIPLAFPHIDNAFVPPIWFYGAWWLVAALLVSYEFLHRLFPARPVSGFHWPVATLICLSIPWLSLVAHLGILHYVYASDYVGADAAPMLLALAVLVNRVAANSGPRRLDLVILRLILPLAAVMVSANNPALLSVTWNHFGHFALTPLRLAIVGAYLAVVYSFFRPYWISLLAGGVMAGVAAILGPSVEQIDNLSQEILNRCLDFAWKMIPKTLIGWGTTAIAASFAFLGLGAAVSFRQQIPSAIPVTNVEPRAAGNELSAEDAT